MAILEMRLFVLIGLEMEMGEMSINQTFHFRWVSLYGAPPEYCKDTLFLGNVVVSTVSTGKSKI